MALREPFRGRCGTQIAGEAADICAGAGFQLSYRLIHGRLHAAVDDDARAFARKTGGDCTSNAGGATADQSESAFKFEIHGRILSAPR
jgi:hypothetical protein